MKKIQKQKQNKRSPMILRFTFRDKMVYERLKSFPRSLRCRIIEHVLSRYFNTPEGHEVARFFEPVNPA